MCSCAIPLVELELGDVCSAIRLLTFCSARRAFSFYTGTGLQNIISWTGLFVQGTINFCIPLIIYIVAVRKWQSPAVQPLINSLHFRGIASVNSSRKLALFTSTGGSAGGLYGALNGEDPMVADGATPSMLQATTSVHSSSSQQRRLTHPPPNAAAAGATANEPSLLTEMADEQFRAWPDKCRISGSAAATFCCAIVVVLILACIAIDMDYVAKGKSLVG